MVKKIKLGKVVKKVNGYDIRNINKNVSTERTDRKGRVIEKITKELPSGKYGVYAGKKLKVTVDSVSEAVDYAS